MYTLKLYLHWVEGIPRDLFSCKFPQYHTKAVNIRPNDPKKQQKTIQSGIKVRMGKGRGRKTKREGNGKHKAHLLLI